MSNKQNCEIQYTGQSKAPKPMLYCQHNGLVNYFRKHCGAGEKINIPFELFDEYMQKYLTIEKDGATYRIIVNANRSDLATFDFFNRLQKLGEEFFIKLYKAVWNGTDIENIPVTITEFHEAAENLIKEYAQKIEEKNEPTTSN